MTDKVIWPVNWWAAVSPDGEIDIERLCVLKGDCRLTKAEVRDGWTVEPVALVKVAR